MTTSARKFVSFRHADGVATVELVNAKSMNILGSGAIEELTGEFQRLARQSDIRVVVLRGTGDKAFIGGADINEMAALDRIAGEAFIRGLAGLCEAIRTCPAPVIARLAGWCLGGGLEVAMSCDLRVAGAGARFGMPEVAAGIPSVIHAALLPAMIGASRTRGYCSPARPSTPARRGDGGWSTRWSPMTSSTRRSPGWPPGWRASALR